MRNQVSTCNSCGFTLPVTTLPQNLKCMRCGSPQLKRSHEKEPILLGDLLYGIDANGRDAALDSFISDINTDKTGHVVPTGEYGTMKARYGIFKNNAHILFTADAINNRKAELVDAYAKKNSLLPQAHPHYAQLVNDHENLINKMAFGNKEWDKLCKGIVYLIANQSSQIAEKNRLVYEMMGIDLVAVATKDVTKFGKSISSKELRQIYRMMQKFPNFRPVGLLEGLDVGMPWEIPTIGSIQEINRRHVKPYIPGRESKSAATLWMEVTQAWSQYRAKYIGFDYMHGQMHGTLSGEILNLYFSKSVGICESLINEFQAIDCEMRKSTTKLTELQNNIYLDFRTAHEIDLKRKINQAKIMLKNYSNKNSELIALQTKISQLEITFNNLTFRNPNGTLYDINQQIENNRIKAVRKLSTQKQNPQLSNKRSTFDRTKINAAFLNSQK